MLEEQAFPDLMRRVRAGEQDAAAELVRLYEPEIRRAIRVWLTDSSLRRRLDSMDVSQSIFANFFVRAAAGQFELERPAQLFKLLVTMARNRLRDEMRKHQAEGSGSGLENVADGQPSPSQVVAADELLRKLRAGLSASERDLAEQRALGRPWAEIAAERGASPEALRKQLARAVDRAARAGVGGGES